jgi:SAM-dependent methyltransferase
MVKFIQFDRPGRSVCWILCTKPSLRTRLERAINLQAARPSGWFGRVLGLIWPHEHRRLNAEVLDADIRPSHRVLEIGSGTGHALREAARRARDGKLSGIDISPLMVALARNRNRAGIERGQVGVKHGDAASLTLQPAEFDRIFSVHCIHFWRDLDAVLRTLASALKPGGRLVLAFRPDGPDVPARFRDPIYRFPRLDEVEAALRSLGLVVQRSAASSAERGGHVIEVRAVSTDSAVSA